MTETAYLSAFSGARLHVGFVELDHIGAGVEEILDFPVHGPGVIGGEGFLVAVEIILSLLGHGERPREGDLDPSVRVRPQELDVLHLDGPPSRNLSDDPRHGVGVAGTVHGGAVVIDIDPVEGGRYPVGIALPANFAVRNNVETRLFLVPDGKEGGVVLGLLEEFFGDSPNFPRPNPGGEPLPQVFPVHQPVGLDVAANNRCGEDFFRHRFALGRRMVGIFHCKRRPRNSKFGPGPLRRFC